MPTDLLLYCWSCSPGNSTRVRRTLRPVDEQQGIYRSRLRDRFRERAITRARCLDPISQPAQSAARPIPYSIHASIRSGSTSGGVGCPPGKASPIKSRSAMDNAQSMAKRETRTAPTTLHRRRGLAAVQNANPPRNTAATAPPATAVMISTRRALDPPTAAASPSPSTTTPTALPATTKTTCASSRRSARHHEGLQHSALDRRSVTARRRPQWPVSRWEH